MRYNYLHLTILTALLFLIFIVATVRSLYTAAEEKKIVDAFLAEQQQAAIFETPALSQIYTFEEPTAAPEASLSEALMLPKYRKLYLQNNDTAGWIKIAGTKIDLPVMYTPLDPEFYLRRFFDKSDNKYGTPFIDARCSLQPRSGNIIIHGHNMKDDKMFGTLPLYAEKDYYNANPIIEFDTLYETGKYQVVSAFLSEYNEYDASPKLYYNYIDLHDNAEMAEFSELVGKLSLYDTGYTLVPGDQVITLITCSYHVANGRMTVVAKKITDDE